MIFLNFSMFFIHAITTFPPTIDIIDLCLDLITTYLIFAYSSMLYHIRKQLNKFRSSVVSVSPLLCCGASPGHLLVPSRQQATASNWPLRIITQSARQQQEWAPILTLMYIDILNI